MEVLIIPGTVSLLSPRPLRKCSHPGPLPVMPYDCWGSTPGTYTKAAWRSSTPASLPDALAIPGSGRWLSQVAHALRDHVIAGGLLGCLNRGVPLQTTSEHLEPCTAQCPRTNPKLPDEYFIGNAGYW